jgi:hypothetical protein
MSESPVIVQLPPPARRADMETTDVIDEAMDKLLNGDMTPAAYIAIVRKANEELAARERQHLEQLQSA